MFGFGFMWLTYSLVLKCLLVYSTTLASCQANLLRRTPVFKSGFKVNEKFPVRHNLYEKHFFF